jgi:hypothetical protein
VRSVETQGGSRKSCAELRGSSWEILVYFLQRAAAESMQIVACISIWETWVYFSPRVAAGSSLLFAARGRGKYANHCLRIELISS